MTNRKCTVRQSINEPHPFVISVIGVSDVVIELIAFCLLCGLKCCTGMWYIVCVPTLVDHFTWFYSGPSVSLLANVSELITWYPLQFSNQNSISSGCQGTVTLYASSQHVGE